MILLELKSDPEKGLPTRPLPFDRKALEGLEGEILSVFSRNEIVTPGRGPGILREPRPRPSASEAGPRSTRSAGGSCSRSTTRTRSATCTCKGTPALEGRLMFASVAETHPAAAWFKINDPIADFDRIRRLVAAGFLVRTRADANTRQARSGDTTMRDKALSSGAQFVSTDYPVPDPGSRPIASSSRAGPSPARTP